MTLTLTLREAPVAPVDAPFRPERLAALSQAEIERLEVLYGNRRATVGELFDVSGSGEEDVRVVGDLARVAWSGRGHDRRAADGRGQLLDRTSGRGCPAASLWSRATRATGPAPRCRAGGWSCAAPPAAGSAAPTRGRAPVCRAARSSCLETPASEAGAGLRRGLIAVAGSVGAAAGLSALAGTIVAFGAVGPHPGAGMRRASIVAMTSATLLPTYAPACAYRPPFLRLCLRRLRALGLPVTDEQIEGRYTRWSGDAVELRRAEILILEPTR